ncbi:MAG: transcription antitermination factor NusB [Anaerolineales bacterium]
MKPRTRARSIALQALYEIDLTGHPPEQVIAERLSESPMEDNLGDFARNIVLGIIPIVHELDQVIARHAPEWPLDQVAIIDRNIMRIALWEIAVSNQTPLKVAINEAVELGKLYGSDSTPRFVNGVLGSLALHYNDIVQYFRSLLS